MLQESTDPTISILHEECVYDVGVDSLLILLLFCVWLYGYLRNIDPLLEAAVSTHHCQEPFPWKPFPW